MISPMPSLERDDLSVRVPISFSAELYEWLRQAAFRRRVSMAEVVREALREHRKREEPQLDLPISRESGD
jgi:Arc/MetJ-type ribon-helix-helix transcriptional regulator